MDDYVHRKFPEHTDSIQALMEKDAAFRATCADFEEMCTWLAAQCRSADPGSEELGHAWELIRDLEDEIRNRLVEHNDIIR